LRLRNPETGLVVSCEGDLAARYQSRGWEAPDGPSQPATEAVSDEPQEDAKPVRRGQTRRRQQ